MKKLERTQKAYQKLNLSQINIIEKTKNFHHEKMTGKTWKKITRLLLLMSYRFVIGIFISTL